MAELTEFDESIGSVPTGKRIMDLVLGIFLVPIFFLPALIIALLISISSDGPILYWSDRVGQDNKIFRMPKFRTMKSETPQLATHLLDKPEFYLTPIGSFLRKCSLDELPQLYSILCGDLSFVGPRPALFNQHDLISLRESYGIHKLKPGLTGWAQINGRDSITIQRKVDLDLEYLVKKDVILDAKILFLTVARVIRSEGIRH